ncbi:protein of unknown function [Methylocella tundrae]|uniref:Uncharacterized protein n=1 Tax=Methylocella tundrae TaxID=227605 RepID=A0A4U8YZX9_METTU|nr:protein of unknown function [Methylocella tundrae]
MTSTLLSNTQASQPALESPCVRPSDGLKAFLVASLRAAQALSPHFTPHNATFAPYPIDPSHPLLRGRAWRTVRPRLY